MAGDLYASVASNNKLYKFAGFSTTISSSLAITGVLGVCIDDTYTYWGINTGKALRGVGFSATVHSSFTGSYFSNMGLTSMSGGDLLMSGDTSHVWRTSGFSSTVISSFNEAESNIRGTTWDGSNVITSAFVGKKIRKHSGFSVTVTSSFLMSGFTKDVAWDGTNVIVTNANARYCLMSGFSSTVSSSISVVAGDTDPYGIDWYAAPNVLFFAKLPKQAVNRASNY